MYDLHKNLETVLIILLEIIKSAIDYLSENFIFFSPDGNELK